MQCGVLILKMDIDEQWSSSVELDDVLSQSVISSTPTDTVGESNLYHACGLDNTAWLQLYTRYYVKCFCNKTMQTCSSTAIEGQRSK
jgi:hypothetical protein